LQSKSRDAPRADEAEWVALLEGNDAAPSALAHAQPSSSRTLKNFGVSVAPKIGTYQFLFGNQRLSRRPERSEGPRRRLQPA
jgi:hypothetical protein